MATKSKPSVPLTFDLTEDLAERLEACRRGHGFTTFSDVVRTAIEGFDFASCRPERVEHRQISVRLAPELRALLRRHARLKRVSVGALLRLALGAMPSRPGRK